MKKLKFTTKPAIALSALLVACFGCDKSKDVSNNIVEKKDTTINNGMTVNYQCTCGQYIIAHGTFKNGDKIQCGKCGLEVTYQNGS